MRLRLTTYLAFALLPFLSVAGCGTYVPDMAEVGENSPKYPLLTSGGALEFQIKAKVYCDIFKAVINNSGLIPSKWAAQYTLDLQVDEVSALNPGISLITPLPSSQSYTTGLGATLSSQGTREDKFGQYLSLDNLKRYKAYEPEVCPDKPFSGTSLLLLSELNIDNWLRDHLIAEDQLPSSMMPKDTNSDFKQSTISYHVKFIVITTGSVTPTWKLVRVATGNGSLPFASTGRTRTHDLLITWGPAFKPGALNIAANSHAAQEVGIAVGNGTRNPFVP